MELDYALTGISSGEMGPAALVREWYERRRSGLYRFLNENQLTEFQRSTLLVLLDPDSGPEDFAALIAELSGHAMYLDSIGWKPQVTTKDKVQRPAHYARFPLEPTQYAVEYGLDWLEGNALKYICRFPFKNGTEDLRKAARYLEMMVKYHDGVEGWSK